MCKHVRLIRCGLHACVITIDIPASCFFEAGTHCWALKTLQQKAKIEAQQFKWLWCCPYGASVSVCMLWCVEIFLCLRVCSVWILQKKNSMLSLYKSLVILSCRHCSLNLLKAALIQQFQWVYVTQDRLQQCRKQKTYRQKTNKYFLSVL